MRLLAMAAGVMLVAVVVLLAMVIRLIEPSLALSLISYATLCAGMGIGLAGALRCERSRR